MTYENKSCINSVVTASIKAILKSLSQSTNWRKKKMENAGTVVEPKKVITLAKRNSG